MWEKTVRQTQAMPRGMRELLEGRHLCVLATSGPQGPHASLMSYLMGEAPHELMLISPRDTTKFRNILAEPRVSLLVDGRESAEPAAVNALTISAVARVVEEEGGRRTWLERFSRRLPQLAGLCSQPHAQVLMVQMRSLMLLTGPQNAEHFSFDKPPA